MRYSKTITTWFILRSSENSWSLGVGCVRLLPSCASNTSRPVFFTTSSIPCCTCVLWYYDDLHISACKYVQQQIEQVIRNMFLCTCDIEVAELSLTFTGFLFVFCYFDSLYYEVFSGKIIMTSYIKIELLNSSIKFSKMQALNDNLYYSSNTFSFDFYIRVRVNNSLQPSFFSSHGCIYTKMAVSTSSMILCLSCHVTWIVLHAWLHYGISIKVMHFDHCQ